MSPQHKSRYMEKTLHQNINLEELLKPENPIELDLIEQAEFKKGLLWGFPRFGHPEGKVVYHIKEVLENIDKLNLNDSKLRDKLRLIAFAHDTFKHLECKNRQHRDWSKHHGVIARQFVSKYTDDPSILNTLQWHDEAYYVWRLEHIYRDQEASKERLNRLLNNVGEFIQLYYLFFVCDTRTGDKNQAPLKWFERSFSDINLVKI